MTAFNNRDLTDDSPPGWDTTVRPSLLEPQSTGGDIAESGFSFQANYTLTCVCSWLVQDGFTSMIREAIGDVEANFYVPGYGYKKELVEIKNHPLTPSLFWNEIERFQQLQQHNPGLYRRFVLASAGLSRDLQPVLSALQRLQGPQSFYERESPIFDQSLQDFCARVEKMGKKREDALFLLQSTDVVTNVALYQSQGEALFIQTFVEYFPEYQDFSARQLREIYRAISDFVGKRRNKIIARKELEEKIRESIPLTQRPLPRPVELYTLSRSSSEQSQEASQVTRGLCFAWDAFAGDGLPFSPPPTWNAQILTELEQTRTWMLTHCAQRRIRLLGERRLPISLAIGATFSAIRGFTLEMNYRGNLFATDSHPDEHTPPYEWAINSQLFEHSCLIVSIGILREVSEEVMYFLQKQEKDIAPSIHLFSSIPLISAAHANKAVQQAKNLIAKARAKTHAKKIELFLACPSYFALFLGHRLNALATIQSYQYKNAGEYLPACTLFLDSTSQPQESPGFSDS